MKTQKLSIQNFASEELTRNQKTAILGKGGATTLPEVDEDGNLVGSAGPGDGATGPGGATNTGTGDGKQP